MFDRKYLRGDPKLPFNSDPKQVKELLEKFHPPTHEPLWFLRNRGTCSPADVEYDEKCVSRENIETMSKLGIHIPKRIFFFKGFGLERERPYIEKTIKYAKELHARNMLVSVYVGGTIFTDYFFKEVPEAREWARVDMDGLPVTYGGYQLMRWFPCLNNPGYRDYTKRVLETAIKEVDADEIFFDNQILRYEPRTCRCKHCVRHMREMIKEKYSLEECERRYGLPEYPDVEPPVFSQANKPWRLDKLQRPQMQDWVDHRVKTVIDFYEEMDGYVKSLKPSCAVGMNIKGIHGHNRAFDHGISHGRFADILDFTCIDGYRPGRIRGADTFWSEIRLFKQTHSTNIAVVDRAASDLTMVENTVFPKRKFIPDHGWVGSDPLPVSAIGRFLCANRNMFLDREHVFDIAVLRSEPSTDYNCAKVHEQLMAFEQTLAVEKLPWTIIFDRNMNEIDNYRIIALPEIQALSDAWLESLDKFMRSGGGVIASGEAAGYNDWYRPRTPRHAFEPWLGHPPGAQYEVAEVGRGRFVYAPEWDVHTRWNIDDWFAIHGAGLKPVKDRKLFRKAISDAAAGRSLSFEVSGSDFVFVEGLLPEGGIMSGMNLHFINYDSETRGPEMQVRVKPPEGSRCEAVVLIDPEDEAGGFREKQIEFDEHDGQVGFTTPVPRVYSIAELRFTPA